MDTQIDPAVVNMAKAIRQKESNGDFSAKGKAGEIGAYQYTPDTWKAVAPKYGVSVPIEQATPEQQNAVTYNRIKAWKDAGHDVTEIASMWNAGEGEPMAYTGKFGSTTPTHKIGDPSVIAGKFDVPGYVKEVATNYQKLKGGSGTDTSSAYNTKVDLPEPPPQEDTSLQAPKFNTGVSALDRPLALEQGLGYALSNLTGTQDKAIKALDDMMKTQTDLLKRIKENKAKGKDTTRLQKALDNLTVDIKKAGGDVTNVGTGGITNNQVLASAGAQAVAIPGIIAGAGAVPSGALNPILWGGKGIENAGVKQILKYALGKGETLANLSPDKAKIILENYITKEMPITQLKSKLTQNVLKALNDLNPTLGKEGMIKTLIKGSWNTAKNLALYHLIESTVGGAVSKFKSGLIP